MKNHFIASIAAIILCLLIALIGFLGLTSQVSASTVDIPEQEVEFLTLVPGGIDLVLSTATRTPTPINIGNFVWDDIDHDGRQDAGEPGLAGVTVQLWNASKTQLITESGTNTSGIYSVIAPVPGNYRIRVLLPDSSDSFSPKDQAGGDNQKDSDINGGGADQGFTDVFNLANNVISTTVMDAGIIKYRTPTPTRTPTPINIGNFVWKDLDKDGRQDAGEPGLAGVTVQLWNAAKTQLITESGTNTSGIYSVIAPVPGDYRIRVLLPAEGDTFSPKDQAGGDNQKDSDINPSGGDFGFTDVFNLANNLISTTIMDVGIIKHITINHGVFSSAMCSLFKLTSPLDGLPNGAATFYWDTLKADNVSYQITIYDESRRILKTIPAGKTNTITFDVSRGAIGGLYQLTVKASVIVNGKEVCTDEHTIFRAAGAQPVATPTRSRN
jgi:hypothetical protein